MGFQKLEKSRKVKEPKNEETPGPARVLALAYTQTSKRHDVTDVNACLLGGSVSKVEWMG